MSGYVKHQLPQKAIIANEMGLNLHSELSGWLEAIINVFNSALAGAELKTEKWRMLSAIKGLLQININHTTVHVKFKFNVIDVITLTTAFDSEY